MRHAFDEALLLLFLVGLHWVIDRSLQFAFPEYKSAIHVVRLFVFVAFLFGYLTQAVDILFTVAPWSRSILDMAGKALVSWVRRKLRSAGKGDEVSDDATD